MIGELMRSTRRKKDARVGYQVAATLWAYEGSLVWARFNAMLMANSILLGVIALMVTADRDLLPIWLLFCAAGVLLCYFWWLMTERGFDYYSYWVGSARELEEAHLQATVSTVSRGAQYASGKRVFLTLDGQREPFEMSTLGSTMSIRRVTLGVTMMFGALYILIPVTQFLVVAPAA